MDALSFVALALLLLLAALIGFLIWFLGSLPGHIASQRNHPYAQAIWAGGWATLLIGFVGWPFVLMWAYASRPNESSMPANGTRDLEREIERLRARVEELSSSTKVTPTKGDG